MIQYGKVTCYRKYEGLNLTIGKKYEVITSALNSNVVKIKDDEDIIDWYHKDIFTEEEPMYWINKEIDNENT